MSVWMIVGPVAVLTLAVWLLHGCVQLERLLREADRDQRAADRLVLRYGGSLSWNDEGPAQVDARRTSSATRSRKG